MRKAELKFLSGLRRVHSKLTSNQLNNDNSKILIIPGEVDFMIDKSSNCGSNDSIGSGNTVRANEQLSAEPYTQIKVPNWLVEGYETIELKDAVHLIRQWPSKAHSFEEENFQFSNKAKHFQNQRNNRRCTASSSIRISAGGIAHSGYHSLLLPRVVKSCMTLHSPTNQACIIEKESILEAQQFNRNSQLPLLQKFPQIFTDELNTATRSALTSTPRITKTGETSNNTNTNINTNSNTNSNTNTNSTTTSTTTTTTLKTRQAKENFAKKYILHSKKFSNNSMRRLRKSIKQKVRKICSDSNTKDDGIQLTLKYVCSKQMVDGRSEIHCYTSENNGEYNDWTDDLEKKVIFEKILRKLFDSNGSGISFKIEKLKDSKSSITTSNSICCHQHSIRSSTSSTIALSGSQDQLHSSTAIPFKCHAKDELVYCTVDQLFDNEQQHSSSSTDSWSMKNAISEKPLPNKQHSYPTRHTSKSRNSTKLPKYSDNTNTINSLCENISVDSLQHKYVCSALMGTHHHPIHHTKKCQHSQQILHALYQQKQQQQHQQHQTKSNDLTTPCLECFNCMDDKPMIRTTKEYTISTPDNSDLPETISIPDLFNHTNHMNHMNHTKHLDDIRSNDLEYIQTNRCLYSSVNTQPQHIYNIVGSMLSNQEKRIIENGKRKSNYF